MHKVALMTATPTTCLHCGRGNTPDDPHSMDDFWVVDLERDVNWGDSTYICRYCCDQIAAIAGFVTMDDLAEQQRINQKLKEKNHDLEAELDEKSRRLKRIAQGRKALKKTQEEATA